VNSRAALVTLRYSRPVIPPVAGVAALVFVFLVLRGNTFWSTLVVDMLVFGIAAMALDFLGGYAGLISLAQASFLGVGAYGVAIAENHAFSPWAAVGISLAVVLALALVLGVVAVRVKGISFVIITLAVGQVLWGLAFEWVGLSEGDNGISPLGWPSLGPINLNDPLTMRMAVLFCFVVIALVLVMFVHSPFGLSLRGVRSNETRLAALGYQTGLHRYIAWVISVFFAGFAGVLYIFTTPLIDPTTLQFSTNGLIVVMVVLGGLRSIWGAALGAVVVVLFQQYLVTYVTRWQTLMGLTMIAVVLFSPGGLWGMLRALGRWRDRLIRRMEAAQAARPGQPAVVAATPAGAGQQTGQAQDEATERAAGQAAGAPSDGGP
jgi:branched-chain amino acid transport system permease protein